MINFNILFKHNWPYCKDKSKLSKTNELVKYVQRPAWEEVSKMSRNNKHCRNACSKSEQVSHNHWNVVTSLSNLSPEHCSSIFDTCTGALHWQKTSPNLNPHRLYTFLKIKCKVCTLIHYIYFFFFSLLLFFFSFLIFYNIELSTSF